MNYLGDLFKVFVLLFLGFLSLATIVKLDSKAVGRSQNLIFFLVHLITFALFLVAYVLLVGIVASYMEATDVFSSPIVVVILCALAAFSTEFPIHIARRHVKKPKNAPMKGLI
jgi:hypothetical protein